MIAIWDADYLGYKIAFAMEQRFVEYNGMRWNNRSEIIQKMKDEFGEEGACFNRHVPN